GDERRRQRGRADDDALVPFGVNGVVTVFAVEREAFVAAFEEALHVLVAEIPTAISLAEVAAERAHVANLGPADIARRGRQSRERLPHTWVLGDGRDCGSGADGH